MTDMWDEVARLFAVKIICFILYTSIEMYEYEYILQNSTPLHACVNADFCRVM
jgi:hypothetical protein